MSPSVSVTQLTLASDSWSEFLESLKTRKAPFKQSGEFPGALFHDHVAKPFMQKLRSGDLPDLAARILERHGDPERLALAILEALHIVGLAPALARKGADLKADQMVAMGEATHQLAAALAKIFHSFAKPGTADQVAGWVIPPEKLYEMEVDLPGGPPLRVTGRLDAALFDPQRKRARVIDYKCKTTESAAADLLQIAMYGWLLSRETGLEVDGTLLYVGSRSATLEYPSAELAQVACSATTMEFLRKVRDTVAKPSGADPTAELLAALRRLKCRVTALEPIVGPRVIRCRVVPDLSGTTVSKLMAQDRNLQVALGLEAPPVIESGSGYVAIDIPRREAKPVMLADLLATTGRPASVVAFPLGMAIDGRVHWADMADSNMTSILVGGTAGSGKSEFLRSIVLAIALTAGPAAVRFTLVDPKRVTFMDLEELPHLDGLFLEPPAALERLAELVLEMERRYLTIAAAGAKDIKELHAKGHALSHHVVLIDEYADLMTDKAMREELETAVQRLAQKGRAAGMHVVLATQRPDAKVVSPLVKANLQLKVALKVSTRKNSEVILDAGGAQNLLGRGDMLVGGPIPIVRLQAALATAEDVRRALGAR